MKKILYFIGIIFILISISAFSVHRSGCEYTEIAERPDSIFYEVVCVNGAKLHIAGTNK